jgi:2,3-bisphosphoglycerate-dependent phosphoglycerate mutase
MRYLFLLVTLVLVSCGTDKKDESNQEQGITTTYYLIRHAEKDRTTPDNPRLTAKGKERAMHWAEHFKNIPLEGVYSSNYNRTEETAIPIAKSKSLNVQIYSLDTLYSAKFQKATRGKMILVVGHSNTTPAFVNTILGKNKYEEINDTENAMLFTVIVSEMGETTVAVNKIEM